MERAIALGEGDDTMKNQPAQETLMDGLKTSIRIKMRYGVALALLALEAGILALAVRGLLL